jgi:integrase
MDLVFIGVVLRAAKSARSVPVQPTIVEEARTACRELRLIAKSRKRERRPTPHEISLLDEHFKTRRGRIPMQDILWFAIHSARRQDEITRLEWGDNDPEALTGVVHDAKHPTQKVGNHRRFRYTQQAWEIVQRQPRNSRYIFPFKSRSISASFTRGCKYLGIKNLRFHDLRHEATSRLFERGYQIHEVQQFTLHESWSELQRYTHLIPGNMRTL